MRALRSAIIILIVFQYAGIISGLVMWKLGLAWLFSWVGSFLIIPIRDTIEEQWDVDLH